MRRAYLPAGLAALLSVLPAAAAPAGAAPSCRAEYDRTTARIDEEETAIRGMLDADAALVDAPVYRLSETEAVLLEDLAAARAQAAAAYRVCLGNNAPAARPGLSPSARPRR